MLHWKIEYHYLPHQGVVIICFYLTGVDKFSLERSKTEALRDADLICENATVVSASPRSLENDQSWNTESEFKTPYIAWLYI